MYSMNGSSIVRKDDMLYIMKKWEYKNELVYVERFKVKLDDINTVISYNDLNINDMKSIDDKVITYLDGSEERIKYSFKDHMKYPNVEYELINGEKITFNNTDVLNSMITFYTKYGVYIFTGNARVNNTSIAVRKGTVTTPNGFTYEIKCESEGLCIDGDLTTKYNIKVDLGSDLKYVDHNIMTNDDLLSLKINEDEYTQAQIISLYTYSHTHGYILISMYIANDFKFTFELYLYYMNNFTNIIFHTMNDFKDYMKYLNNLYVTLLWCFEVGFSYDRDIIVYSGTTDDINFKGMYKTKVFTSTSLDIRIAGGFMGRNGVITKIIIPKGTSVVPMYAMKKYISSMEFVVNASYKPHEYEVLLSPNTNILYSDKGVYLDKYKDFNGKPVNIKCIDAIII